MARRRVKRKQVTWALTSTTLGDLICQVYDEALQSSHNEDLAKRIACHCARRMVRHQPHLPVI